MSTVAEVTATPASGLNHIDALMEQGPGWNWLTPARNTLMYTFSLADPRAADQGTNYTGTASAFNASQQAATAQALARLTQITGIRFQATTDASAADCNAYRRTDSNPDQNTYTYSDDDSDCNADTVYGIN